jgi:predicted nucleic acid-binding protein
VNYLDSSALVKLAHDESETPALRRWLGAQPGPPVSSALAAIEVTRALRRHDPAAVSRVPAILSQVILVPIDEPIVSAAAALVEPLLRSLDAIHLATALRLGMPNLSFVTYDKRLAAGADQEGLAVVSPV